MNRYQRCYKQSAADDDTAFAVQVADALSAFDAVYYTGHCTGEGECRLLKEKLSDRVFRLCTGLEFKI